MVSRGLERRLASLHVVVLSRAASLVGVLWLSGEIMDSLLDESTRFFASYRMPSGLYADKKTIDQPDAPSLASTAAAGFGMIALCIAVERDLETLENTLRLACETMSAVARVKSTKTGFMLHWCDEHGQGKGEFSTIDTAIFVLGALFASNYCKAKAPAKHGEAARDLSERVRLFTSRIHWASALIEDEGDRSESAAGMFLTVDANGKGRGITRIFNEYYLLALCGAVAEQLAPDDGSRKPCTAFFRRHLARPPAAHSARSSQSVRNYCPFAVSLEPAGSSHFELAQACSSS